MRLTSHFGQIDLHVGRRDAAGTPMASPPTHSRIQKRCFARSLKAPDSQKFRVYLHVYQSLSDVNRRHCRRIENQADQLLIRTLQALVIWRLRENAGVQHEKNYNCEFAHLNHLN
jgi:hypothetical protein